MRAVNIFLAYAPDDAAVVRDIQKSLIMAKRRGEVVFFDQQLSVLPGADRLAGLTQLLTISDLVLLLLSKDYLASDECYELQTEVIARGKAGQLIFIPVLASACNWKEVAALRDLQTLPRNEQYLTQWPNRDEAYAHIGEEITRLVRQIAPTLPALAELDPAEQPIGATDPRQQVRQLLSEGNLLEVINQLSSANQGEAEWQNELMLHRLNYQDLTTQWQQQRIASGEYIIAMNKLRWVILNLIDKVFPSPTSA